MQVVVCKDPEEGAPIVTEKILSALEDRPELVLGLATGSTPIGVYQHLIEAHKDDGVDFSSVRTFNLDEYCGLSGDHPQSYRAFMQKHLFNGLNIPAENIHFPPSEGPELGEKCRQHEEEILRLGESTSNCWESVQTATSASMSPPPRSPREPASRR